MYSEYLIQYDNGPYNITDISNIINIALMFLYYRHDSANSRHYQHIDTNSKILNLAKY